MGDAADSDAGNAACAAGRRRLLRRPAVAALGLGPYGPCNCPNLALNLCGNKQVNAFYILPSSSKRAGAVVSQADCLI